jgi:3-oxoacyl-ACP reductase-like protein
MGQPAMGGPMGGPPPGTPPIGAPGGPAPYDPSSLPNAMQWSTGTRTQGASQGAAGGISGGAVAGAVAVAGGGAASLEAKCAQLQHDVDSLALFARTLLTMLEESKLVTRAQFDETKNRLDMLDGKLDDR